MAREPKNDKKVAFKATTFNKFSSFDGINNKIKIPKIGNNKIYINKLFKFNMFTFYRIRTYDHQFRKLLLSPTELKMFY